LTDETGVINFAVEGRTKGGFLMEKHKRILIPLDGSECAETIIPRVEELATVEQAGICLLAGSFCYHFSRCGPHRGSGKGRPGSGGISSRFKGAPPSQRI